MSRRSSSMLLLCLSAACATSYSPLFDTRTCSFHITFMESLHRRVSDWGDDKILSDIFLELVCEAASFPRPMAYCSTPLQASCPLLTLLASRSFLSSRTPPSTRTLATVPQALHTVLYELRECYRGSSTRKGRQQAFRYLPPGRSILRDHTPHTHAHPASRLESMSSLSRLPCPASGVELCSARNKVVDLRAPTSRPTSFARYNVSLVMRCCSLYVSYASRYFLSLSLSLSLSLTRSLALSDHRLLPFYRRSSSEHQQVTPTTLR